ncbi:hypothetical protein GN244_ATG13212 [Phytophthora infestans]|uniref:Uncharacterized protein n=1 Tax=Phytophthora infestans TaxID=4787 RepID=A0A833W9M8_PHYIN|nr:hypothetical protein GN244_ATG13212 [Phytophthora infestans]
MTVSEDEREENIAERNVAEVEGEYIQDERDDSNNSNSGKERVGSYSTEVEYDLDSDLENSDAKINPGEMEVDNLLLYDGELACTLPYFEYNIDGRLMPLVPSGWRPVYRNTSFILMKVVIRATRSPLQYLIDLSLNAQ